MASVVAYSRRTTQRQKFGEGDDLISNLPDFIIASILSLLPTKDAVSTCVLSKRWEYLWTLITDLSFQDRKRETNISQYLQKKKIQKQHFLNFVNRVLLHLNTASIQSFSLFVSEKYDPSHVNDWISAVLRRGVKTLCLDSLEKLALPSCSLNKFQSLEKLVLKLDPYYIRLASLVCFSSLTLLELSGITFTHDASNNSENINLKFPALQNFKAKNCSWSSFKFVTLEVPLLVVLSIEYDACWLFDESEIKFCAMRLEEFSYIGPISLANISLDVSAVISVYVDIRPSKFTDEDVQETAILVSKFLKQFNSKVECLEFMRCSKVPEQFFFDVSECPLYSLEDLPVFEMLNHLELSSVAFENLLCLLRKTPCLNTLIFREDLFVFNKELLNSVTVPECFRSNLQVVEFRMFQGFEYELSFGKFFIENAEVLKRICFCRKWPLCRSDLKDVREKLFSFKKASNCVIIEFSFE